MLKKIFSKKKFTDKELMKLGAVCGLFEVLYVILVAGFIIVSESLFPAGSGSMIVGIVTVLILLVFSAAISGILIFGFPFYFAIAKKYREALIILGSSGVSMMVVFILLILGEKYIY